MEARRCAVSSYGTDAKDQAGQQSRPGLFLCSPAPLKSQGPQERNCGGPYRSPRTQQNLFNFVALETDIASRYDFHAAFFPIKAARPGGRFLRHIFEAGQFFIYPIRFFDIAYLLFLSFDVKYS